MRVVCKMVEVRETSQVAVEIWIHSYFKIPGRLILLFHIEIEFLDFLAGPGSFSQELQARLHAWVMGKALNTYHVPHLLPAVEIHKIIEDGF